MTALAATGDTWGVPGPTFLLFFVGTAAVLTVGALLHRRRALAGGPSAGGFARPPATDVLHPQQVAYLVGGARQALYSALAGLRASEAIDVRRKQITATGLLTAGATPLDTAVYNAAGRRLPARELPTDPMVRAAQDRIGEELESAGLAVPADARRAARLWSLALLALTGLGAARIVAGLANGRPVGFLVLAGAATFVLGLALQLRPLRITRAGRAALAELRAANQHLAPTRRPAYRTYGAPAAAMGVALYGTASLWAFDPGFAAGAEVQRQAAAGSSGAGWGGDGGDGGGGGCGGGGCGGGCGG